MYISKIGTIVGWGYTDNIYNETSILNTVPSFPFLGIPYVLQHANLTIHSNIDDICVNKGLGVPSPKIVLCAGRSGQYVLQDTNACSGADEGHGLFVNDNTNDDGM